MRASAVETNNEQQYKQAVTTNVTVKTLVRAVLMLFFSLLITEFFFPPFTPAAPQTRYTLAVVPQVPPLMIMRNWAPLIRRVSEYSGVKLELKFYKSIPEFEQDFLKGVPDFVYLNPFHMVMARKAQGYIPLLRDDESELVGILVARKNSAIKTVRDLKGKTIVFPSPNAFAASLYMQALLTGQEKITFSARYVNTHANVYRHVALGDADAGGGVNKTLNKESSDLKDMLRIIFQTPSVSPHPVSAHPRVAPSDRESVIKAFLRIAQSKDDGELLKTVDIARPVRADYDRDYKMIEHLRLDQFTAKKSIQR